MKTITTYFFLLFITLSFAQMGPGGVGTTDGTSNLKIWYNPNNVSSIMTTGVFITGVTNSAGIAALDISETGSQRPTLVANTINGYDEMSFNGSNRLRTGLTLTTTNFVTDQASTFVVAKADNTTQHSSVYLTDPLTGSPASRFSCHIPWAGTVYYDIGICCNNDARLAVSGLTNLTSYSYWSYDANPTTGKQLYRNGSLLQSRPNTRIYANHATQRFNIGGNTSGTSGFIGGITEIVIFKNKINKTKRIIVENYLSAKFGIPSVANDLYTQDNNTNGDFDHNVAGIGQETSSDNHTDSQGTGIIRINTPSTLSDSDYLFWGEETKNPTYNFTTSPGYTERLNSKWRVSKVNDLGTVSVSVKASDLDVSGMSACAPLKLIASNDAGFSTKTTYNMTLTSGVYTATGVNFTDGDYFTFEYIDQIVVDGTQFYNGSGFGNVPDTTDECYKLLVKSTADGLLPLTQGANVSEVEVEVGGVLTVNNGLRLKVTNGIQLDGEIRLLGDSQLIQTHTGISQVSGSGKLYVDKKSNLTNVYQSGYWTSPVTSTGNTFTVGSAMKDGTIPTSATSTPQNITFITGHDGATTSPISISNFWINKLINNLNWFANGTSIDENTSFNPTEGYNMKSSGANTQNFTFIGKPNDGDYSSNITSGKSSLFGNPYPSSLDADTFLLDNQSLFGTLYFWDGLNDGSNTHVQNSYLGGYSTRAIGLGTNYNGGSTPTRYLSVGQGFFVDATASGTVQFKNSQRAFTNTGASNVPPFFSKNTPFPILRIGFEFSIDNGTIFHRQLAVGFRGLTDNFETGYDAIMYDMRATDIALKVSNNTNDFVIIGIEDYSEDAIEIPLHVRLDQQRDVTFRIDGIENFSPNNIFLKDNTTNMYYDLTNPIALNLAIGDYTNRFSITFRNSPLSIDDMVDTTDILITDDVTSLVITSQKDNIENVTIYNILGQLLVSQSNSSTTLNVPMNIEKGRVLLINITLENGQTLTKKWIKK